MTQYQSIPVCFETKAAAAKFVNMNVSTFSKKLNKFGVVLTEGFRIEQRDEILVFKEVVELVQELTEQRDEEATRAAKFEGTSGKEGAWFVGTRVVTATLGDVTKTGSNKAVAQFIKDNSDFNCSPQKLRKALKNGQKCNGYTVQYTA